MASTATDRDDVRDEPGAAQRPLSITPRQLGGIAAAAILVLALVRLIRTSRSAPAGAGDDGADEAGA